MANELLREVATERGWSEQEVNWMAQAAKILHDAFSEDRHCLLYTSPSPRDS